MTPRGRLFHSLRTEKIAYAYLHGFGGSSRSKKGLALQEMIPHMKLPDLNPSDDSERFRVTHALERMDALHVKETERAGCDVKWRLVGSSMGGYIAAKWASMYPDRVDRMVLYCPALSLTDLCERRFGAAELARRERGDTMAMEGSNDEEMICIEDIVKNHGTVPDLNHETLVIHGKSDEVVPYAHSERILESSRRREKSNVSLLSIDGADHSLHEWIPTLLFNTLKHLGNIDHKPFVQRRQ